MPRKLKFKPNDKITPCPKCGNNTDFVFHSQQVMEDGCEVWAVCKCGYNPTENNSMDRMESLMGGCDDDNCFCAIECTWNEVIENQPQSSSVKTK